MDLRLTAAGLTADALLTDVDLVAPGGHVGHLDRLTIQNFPIGFFPP